MIKGGNGEEEMSVNVCVCGRDVLSSAPLTHQVYG